MKVLSLLGGATETVFRLGCGYLLAGRSHECDWPPCILDDPKIPEVSRSLINADSSAYEIDSEVRSISFASEPAYILDQAIIEEIKPDLIIAQDQCRICAVSKTSLDTCEIIGAKQLILKPSSLEDVIGDVGRIAEAMNVPDRGDALMHLMRSRLDFVRAVSNPATPTDSPASPASTPNTPRPKVALLEWCSPLMGCGYWLGELVEIAGGVPLFYSKSTPTLSNIDVLIKAKPDVVIFALCGFDIPRATTELLGAFSAEDWQQLANAVGKVKGLASISRDSGVLETDGGDDAIYIVDGNALCNRSGPRIVESAEALSEAIGGYKRRGLFGHYGTDKLLSWKDALQQHQLKAAQIIDLSLSQSIDPASVSSPSDKSVKLVDIVKLGDPSAVSSVVAEQLKFLADGNIVGAFELNSPGNRARFCSAQRFEMILRSRPEFVALIGPFNTAAQAPRLVGDVNFLMQNQYATQLIEIRMPEAKGGAEGLEQRVQLQWTLSWVAENNTYMTERVGFAPTS